jgi:hypothetical protein
MAKIETFAVNRRTPGTYLIIGCAHAPWHNKKQFNATYKFLVKEGINLQGIILAGDFLDINSLSSHDKGQMPIEGVKLGWEYKESRKLITEIESLPFAKKATKDYIYGNHEARYFKRMKELESHKVSDVIPTPEEGLLLDSSWSVHNDWKQDYIRLGNFLDVMHGEFCNVHTAKKHLDVYRSSVMYFHTHRFQSYVEGSMGSFNGGFSADIDSEVFSYATRAMKKSWMNNQYLVHIDSEGYYHNQPLNFINNKLIINGRKY